MHLAKSQVAVSNCEGRSGTRDHTTPHADAATVAHHMADEVADQSAEDNRGPRM